MAPRHLFVRAFLHRVLPVVAALVLLAALAPVASARALGTSGALPAAAAPMSAAAAPMSVAAAPLPAAAALPLPASELASAAVTSFGAGRTDLFTRSSGGNLVQQYRPSGGSWTRGLNLGGDIASQPAAVSWASGRMDVFARGTDNALWHRAYVSGGWLAWERLGGILTSAPAVASWAPGRLDVFVRNVDNGLSHKTFVNGQGWTAWVRLGGILSSSPAASSWGSGRLDVFVRNVDNGLSHRAFQSGTWSAWQRLDGATLTSQPATAAPGDRQLNVVVRGTADEARLLRWTQATSWTPWVSLGGTFSSGPSAADMGDDVRVVGRSPNGMLYEALRTSPGGTFTSWTSVDPYQPFRRLATWVDTLDYPSLTPGPAVADMQARGVRTLFLSTARFNSANDFFDATEMGQWLDAAHAAGIKVVGWYVPAYGDMERDLRRTVAIGSYVSPGGQRFDATGVDIERFGSDGEVTQAQFNTRLVTHLQQVRSRSPMVIAAIVPSPFGTDAGNRWQGFPWPSIGPNSEVVVPMALWSFRGTVATPWTPTQIHDWVEDQVDRAQALTGRRVHVEGGVIGEGSTPVTVARVQAFVNAVKDGGAVGGSQYDYATMTGHADQWPILAQLNTP